ncbi:ribonuclease [Niveomyces insectorum RCEF 264]|uniref:Ribonuclease n=1 Tax=Niveomyces insectorum RCEF 264 TaxID=1081102 RepID=A0A167ZRS3_9HYPO|nr:ribonuclease [Niveomyces insectorum RCEF 264]
MPPSLDNSEQGGRGDETKRTREQQEGDDCRKRKRESNSEETETDETNKTNETKKASETSARSQTKFELARMTQDVDLDEIVAAQEPVTKSLIPTHIEHGVLIPLKTTLELRDDHQCGQALITRSPIRSTSAVISLLRDLLPEEIVKGMPHLRRCAKPFDLPAHLKSQFMNDSAMSKQIHTGKSNWVYVLLGLEATLSRKEMAEALSKVEGFEDGVFIASIPVPLLAPTSQIQAALWTTQFWPTMYRKNNPLGPHPSMVVRATDEIAADAPIWMAVAHDVATKAKEAGYGEAMGACIVLRGSQGPRLVAVAGDGRWQQQPKPHTTGNPMAHAVLRAISMVAQKLVRAEKRSQRKKGASGETQKNQGTQELSGMQGTQETQGSTSKADVGDNTNNNITNNGADAECGRASPSPRDVQDMSTSQVHNEVQDRVRDRLSRNRNRGQLGRRQRLAYEPFQDKPLLEEESRIFVEEHPRPDGYLCHGLELYVTHEPCAMCSMAILHSRMGKVVFANRMPLTGGLSAEDRILTPSSTYGNFPTGKKNRNGGSGGGGGGVGSNGEYNGNGIHGLGLFWRRELNWSLLAWEWEAHCCCKPLEIAPTTHA